MIKNYFIEWTLILNKIKFDWIIKQLYSKMSKKKVFKSKNTIYYISNNFKKIDSPSSNLMVYSYINEILQD